jgi:hypothetical protein
MSDNLLVMSCSRVVALAVAAVALSWETLPTVAPEKVGLSQERLNRIRPAMERDIAQGEMAGAVGLIARHGKIAYFETYGMVDREASTKKPRARPDSA